ncbi:DUF6352 family protein [Usitatibacter palustris]|uniref:Uncharacterized protein n=1 Tax=Usitatibacter palustris TaxID=2732487 RepID=A0A6M4H917_9PROT|nr:DUF6352 family protein [Usitatibacter palustris]QJR14517.1 hypothetical protein DSM104440_01318 [Usitatibacter palustris]
MTSHQDFWASSGFTLLERSADGGLVATDAWLSRFLDREELLPPDEAGPAERHLHARLQAKPRLRVEATELAAVEDADARENWTHFLRFRDRVLAHPTLEACYASLFREAEVGIAPPFVDALAQVIVRGILDGTDDPWLCRAAELLFRKQRVSTEGGVVLAADAATVEVFSETGGFGNMGRLLRSQDVAMEPPKMDVLSRENAPIYFMRDELFSFLLDLTPGREGAAALAQVLEKWIGHFLGVATTIEPVGRVQDARWRWHVGLDVDSTAILNALYQGETVAPEDHERLAALFILQFRNPEDVLPQIRGSAVYIGLGFRPDRTLKLKPQNLLGNLPLARAG